MNSNSRTKLHQTLLSQYFDWKSAYRNNFKFGESYLFIFLSYSKVAENIHVIWFRHCCLVPILHWDSPSYTNTAFSSGWVVMRKVAIENIVSRVKILLNLLNRLIKLKLYLVISQTIGLPRLMSLTVFFVVLAWH